MFKLSQEEIDKMKEEVKELKKKIVKMETIIEKYEEQNAEPKIYTMGEYPDPPWRF